jgi:hypothetical protein
MKNIFKKTQVRVIKCRKMRGGGACGTHGGVEFIGFWLGCPKGRDHWEDLDVGGRITLRWTLWR